MHSDRQTQVHIKEIILFAVIFGVFFMLALITPLIADDFNYAFGYSSGRRIGSLYDVWISMKWHRMLLNGRVFSHGWLSLVLMYPRWVFAALNATVAVFFSWTSFSFLRDFRCEHPLRAVACLWMLLWICMPGFGQVFFWTAGACNYFWGAALSWFIIWKTVQLMYQENKSILKIILLILPCFVAGAWSEHISFSMLVIIFLLVLWKWKTTNGFPWQMAIILLSGCFGYLFLMFAPATKLFQRIHDAGDPTERNNLTRLIEMIPGGVITICVAVMMMVILLIVIMRGDQSREKRKWFLSFLTGCGIVATAYFVFCGFIQDGLYGLVTSTQAGFFASLSLYLYALCTVFKSEKNEERIISLILSFGGLCGFSLFLFGEYLPVRGFCSPVIFCLLSFVFLLGVMQVPSEKKKKVSLLTLALCFSIFFLLGVTDILSVHHQADEREAEFLRAANSDKTVITKPYSYRTKYTAQFGNPDLSPDADWPNGVMADYYQVIRIIVE